MQYLTKNQIKVLRKCSAPVSFQSLSSSEQSICLYLSDLGFVTLNKEYVDDHSDSYFQLALEIRDVTITEPGRSFLAGVEDYELRFRKQYRLDIFAVAISAGALVISIIALLK